MGTNVEKRTANFALVGLGHIGCNGLHCSHWFALVALARIGCILFALVCIGCTVSHWLHGFALDALVCIDCIGLH